MKLSTKGRYAVTAMMDLALHDNEGPITLSNISKNQEISLSYLEQLFFCLKGSGLVQGLRGPGGGYRLGRSLDQINIAEIILAVDVSIDSTTCKGQLDCNDGERCLTHYLWNDLSEQLFTFLSEITLEELIKTKDVKKPPIRLDDTTHRISTMFPVTKKPVVKNI